MTSILQKGALALAAATSQTCGLSITYRRGDNAVAGVSAVVGQTPFRIDDAAGASIVSRHRDFIFDAADLVIDGAAATPERGDEIDQADGAGDTVTYRVTAPAGEAPWRYVDEANSRIRVHTIRAE